METGVRAASWTLAALAGLGLTLGGCSSGQPSRRDLTAGDFASPASSPSNPPAQSGEGPGKAGEVAARPKPIPTRTRPVSIAEKPAPTDPKPREVQAEPGSPLPAADASAKTEALLIDAKIGDVNNRALYASGFLEPMEAAMKAKAVELLKARNGDVAAVRAEWERYAFEQVQGRLVAFVRDEIFRAEGMASLKPEQKAGLQYYINRIRDEEIRKNQGSLTLTDEEISRQTGGQSLDQYMQSREQLELIRFQLYQQIDRKVQVAWRDIKQQYERDGEKYNPPPTAYYRLIIVSKNDKDGLKAVGDALASGTSFAEVAKGSSNLFNRDQGGLRSMQFEGEITAATLSDYKPVNEALRALAPGASTGPIDNGSTTVWAKLESIERRGVSLYDAQLAIENEIFTSRQERAIQLYITKLQGRASLTDLDEMGQRILQYARERVLEPVLKAAEKPPAGATSGTPAPVPAVGAAAGGA